MEKQPLNQSETLKYYGIIIEDLRNAYPDKAQHFGKLDLCKDDIIVAAEINLSNGQQLYKNYYLSDLEDQHLFNRFNKLTNNEI